MAAQQEAIRRAMQQMKEQMSKEGNLKMLLSFNNDRGYGKNRKRSL